MFPHLVTRTTELNDQNVLKNQSVPGLYLNLTLDELSFQKIIYKLIWPKKLKKETHLGKSNLQFFCLFEAIKCSSREVRALFTVSNITITFYTFS